MRAGGKGNGVLDILYTPQIGEEVIGKTETAPRILAPAIFVGIVLHLLRVVRLRRQRQGQQAGKKQDDKSCHFHSYHHFSALQLYSAEIFRCKYMTNFPFVTYHFL